MGKDLNNSKPETSLQFIDQLQALIETIGNNGSVQCILCNVHILQYTVLAVALAYLYWKLFHQPYDLFMDFTELGFEDVDNPENIRNNTSRRNAINEMRRRKKNRKLPPAYPNGWYAVLESKVLKVGQAREMYALGNNFVVWRGSSGCAYVADAYCPHIGAHLGVGGEVRGECIQCPFHSWAFDGKSDGKLVSIPYSDKLPEFVKIKMWKTFETDGFIFIWNHAESLDPTWHPDEIPEINLNTWSYRGRSEMRVACHIQEIPENGADPAHLNVLHSDLVLCGDNPKESFFSWNFIKHVWKANWTPNTDDPNRRHEAIVKVNHHIMLFGWLPCLKINVDIHQTGPGIVALHFNTFLGKAVFIQTVTPIEPLLQRVVHHFYSSSWIIHPLAKLIIDGEAKQVKIVSLETFAYGTESHTCINQI
ncbi:cholesterol 7-desaturase isoform X2 [Folsomia candida]|uniref:cholesterol 7-desaturase isoform X2 n=1 Tax=Folsomia candida TaxID=158441 RepID=UPI0016052EFD|nr:cholesterol 7-desaturase isoform X2 [Folsomia candida]